MPLNLLLTFRTGNEAPEVEVVGDVTLGGKPFGAEGEVDMIELRGADIILVERSICVI